MLLYHLDRGAKLKKGLTIELGEDKYSIFGRGYVEKFRQYRVAEALRSGYDVSLAHLDSPAFREYALEFMRLHHPIIKNLKLPSRLCAFFATGSVEDAIQFAKRNDYKGEVRVFEVHTEGDSQFLDMTWLDREFPKQISNDGIVYHLFRYWTGELFANDPHVAKADPRPSVREHLVTRSITVGDRVV